MRLTLVVVIAVVGVLLTVLAAARAWRASRRGAPRELVLGYIALMVVVGLASMLLLRVA